MPFLNFSCSCFLAISKTSFAVFKSFNFCSYAVSRSEYLFTFAFTFHFRGFLMRSQLLHLGFIRPLGYFSNSFLGFLFSQAQHFFKPFSFSAFSAHSLHLLSLFPVFLLISKCSLDTFLSLHEEHVFNPFFIVKSVYLISF